MVMLAGSFHAVAAGKTHAEGRLLSNRQARALLAQLTNELHGAVQTPLIASHVLLIGQGRHTKRRAARQPDSSQLSTPGIAAASTPSAPKS